MDNPESRFFGISPIFKALIYLCIPISLLFMIGITWGWVSDPSLHEIWFLALAFFLICLIGGISMIMVVPRLNDKIRTTAVDIVEDVWKPCCLAPLLSFLAAAPAAIGNHSSHLRSGVRQGSRGAAKN